MGIGSHVVEHQILTIPTGQCVDGFTVVVENDDEFGGSYDFTHAYDAEMAHDAIFAGNATNNENGHVNE